MALTKITSAIIEAGAIDATALADNSITIGHLDCSDGTAGQFLKTDGSGTLSFGSVPAGYTDSDVESYLSGGTGVTYSSGQISIGQDVGTTATPTFGNITTTGYIAGPATFTIDPAAVGDNTGTLVVAGNLQVDGTTTTINSTTMEVDDLNITLASGAANAAAANGAGITVDGASATLLYQSTSDAWSFNKNVGIGTSPSSQLHLSAATPTIQFTDSDNNADAYIQGTDGNLRFFADDSQEASNSIITFSVDGSEHMKIDNLGRVGINRTPSISNSKLEVGGADNVSLINVEASGVTGGMGIGSTGLQFFHGSTARMRIDGSGNVGIGTDTPNSKLHVSNGSAGIQLSPDGISDGISFLQAYDWVAQTYDSLRYYANDHYFYTGNNERMLIDSSGNVGIAATPSGEAASAHVVRLGDRVCITEYDDGSNPEQFNLFHNSDYSETYIETGYATNIQQRNGEITFKTAASGTAGAAITFSDKVKILNNGNVGIGTTEINQLLTVNTPARNDTETNSLGQLVVAGPISGPPSHDFTNSNCILRVQGTNATNNIQFGVGNGTYGYNPWIQASYDNSSAVHTDHNSKNLLINPLGGNVAIGKETYASAKLEAMGSIYANNEGGSAYSSYGTGAEIRVVNLSVNQSATHYIEIGGNLPGYTAGQYNCLSTDLGDLHFGANGVYTGYISYNGGFTDISDEREKENIVTISNATAKLKQLRGVYHTWKDTENRGTDTHIGLIAQEVEAVVPEVVTTSNPTSLNTPESDTAGLKGVAYAKLVPLLIETIKELEARIQTLEDT